MKCNEAHSHVILQKCMMHQD